jgi:hypothetical protein
MHAKDMLLAQYDLHTRLFLNCLKDFTEKQSNTRAVAGINHVKWLAGHLLAVRINMGKLAGAAVSYDYLPVFQAGTTAQDDASVYPTLEALIDKWNEVSAPVREQFASLSEAALQAPSPFPQPCGDSFTGMWTFLEHHQAYTIGQVSLIRRILGLEAMKYN